MDQFTLGLVEGFYGKPWSWENRRNIAKFLSEYKYSYYIYAPKGDRKLREEWDQLWDEPGYNSIREFRDYCQSIDMKFGLGLSPYNLHHFWNSHTREKLKVKLDQINSLKPHIIWILFDNMKGVGDDIASIQIEIINFIKEHTNTDNLAICPTYYSYDPILKALFGPMPDNYLEKIGEMLHKDIDIIWTGPQVCSREIPGDHLKEINRVFKRKVTLWDNYPVNDSPRLTPFLFLKGYTGRDSSNRDLLKSHCVNPMVQPNLNKMPLATLRDLYFQDSYEAGISWYKNASKIVGAELADTLWEDLDDFEIRGIGSGNTHGTLEEWTLKIEKADYYKALSSKDKRILTKEREDFDNRVTESLTSEEKGKLLLKYSNFKNEYSDEITKWLMGFYFFDPKTFDY